MFKNALKLKKMTTREMCILAMLVAVTAVLSFVSGYLRTPVGKLNISFVSVYVCAAMYGPVAGGVVGAMADLFSVWFSGSGSPLIWFTVIEFINGFIFGLLFYKSDDSKERSMLLITVLAVVCVAVQYGVNLLRIPTLAKLQNLTYKQVFIMRIPSTTLMLAVKLFGIILIEPYMKKFRKLIRN